MADLFNLDDYRQLSGVEVAIDFIGQPFITPEGDTKRLTQTLTIQCEMIEQTLAQVREQGGIPMFEDKIAWFMPWPPAAIRIRNAEEESAGSPSV